MGYERAQVLSGRRQCARLLVINYGAWACSALYLLPHFTLFRLYTVELYFLTLSKYLKASKYSSLKLFVVCFVFTSALTSVVYYSKLFLLTCWHNLCVDKGHQVVVVEFLEPVFVCYTMSVRERINSMNSQSSVEGAASAKKPLKSRNSDGSSRTPLKLPGMPEGGRSCLFFLHLFSS